MANIINYSNVQVVNNNTVVTTIPKVSIPVSTTATAAYNRYKNYNQSNVFQVGTWSNGGTAGTTTMQFNDNWNTVCADFGIKPRSLTMLLTSITSYPPSAAQKADFADNMGFYFPKIVNCLDNAQTGLKYNNISYNIYCMFFGSISNFRREGHIPVYDPIQNHWYQFGFEYRTDNFNPGKVWLVVSNPQVQNTFFPTSGVPIASTANPYPNIPTSGTEGGDGPGAGTSDSNPPPVVPSVSAVGSGLVRLYNPSQAELQSLGQWLWSTTFDVSQLKRLFSDPMDVILGCSIFPVAVPHGSPTTIQFGNIDTQISCDVASSQYTSRIIGDYTIEGAYYSYLDFAPYTKVQIYLPYIGMKELNTDDVMSTDTVKKTLHIWYTIDLLSGACVAHIEVNGDLLYEFGGSCNTQIPLTSRDFNNVISGVIGVAATAVVGAVGTIGAVMTAPEALVGAAAVGGAVSTIASGAKQVMGEKQTVEHASGIGGATGLMASQHVYLIITRPNLCHPENQEHFTGYPGFIYRTVSQLSGYTKFVNFEFNVIHATMAELEELEEWFMVKGVRI